MNFTEHIIDRDVISQFISTVIPRTETCYEWYMDFDLIEKSNDILTEVTIFLRWRGCAVVLE